jgi:hypothetical protein
MSALIANKTASGALVFINAQHRLFVVVMARITLPRESAVVYGELAPDQEVVNIEGNAEEIGGNRAKLTRSLANVPPFASQARRPTAIIRLHGQ